MNIEMSSIGAIRVFRFPEVIDDSVMSEFDECADRLFAEGNSKFLCDLSKTTVISDTGLQAFISKLNVLHKAGGQMVFCMLQPVIREMFSQAGLTHIYKYYDFGEALQMNVLREMTVFFDEYADIHGIQVRRFEEQLHIEVFLEFDPESRMRIVQKSINKMKSALEAKIKGSEVLIIPTDRPLERVTESDDR